MKIEKYSSREIVGKDIIVGDNTYGKIYKMVNNKPSLIAQTGRLSPISTIVNASNSISLVASGEILYVLLNESETKKITDANPDSSIGNLYEILHLSSEETITDILNIQESSSILISTSLGRIISCGKDFLNAYMTGQTTIYANVKNGSGAESNVYSSSVTYALYNKIAQINEDREIEKWKFEVFPSANTSEKVTGVFVGPIIHVKEDLGFWKEISWQETKLSDTEIVVSLRNADSEEELAKKDWEYAFSSNSGESNPIVRQLNNTTIKGQYLQVKVEMSTNKQNVTPIVSNITIQYSTKQASYFFTTKFSMSNNANTNRGMIVASITEPQNTEVRFGISKDDSVDWADYQVVNTDKFFELENIENLKVGIKFISYDENIPEVAEFALMVGGEIVKAINN